MTKPFHVSAQDYYASPLTKTGRHLKDDKNRGEVAQQYLDDWYAVNQMVVDQHIALGLPLNPVPPPPTVDYSLYRPHHHVYFATAYQGRMMMQGGGPTPRS